MCVLVAVLKGSLTTIASACSPSYNESRHAVPDRFHSLPSSTVLSQSTHVTSSVKPSCVRRLLLVATDDSIECDFLAASREAISEMNSSSVFELVYYSLVHVADFLLLLNLLDRVKSGLFEAVYLAPPATTWSRLLNASTKGQPPLRSRSQPLGLSTLNSSELQKVEQSNREWEVVAWIV